MEHHVESLIKEIQSTNSPYVLKLTKITDGSRKGSTFIEVTGKTGFRFLDLHSELRNRIYKLVLVKPDPITIAISRNGRTKVVTGTDFSSQLQHPGQCFDRQTSKWSGEPLNELSLLAVNKQIHGEATPIAYGNNQFIQGSETALAHFVPTVGLSINFLTVVDFGERCTRKNMKRHFVTLRSATGLRKLKLSAPMAMNVWWGGDMGITSCASELAKDIKKLLRHLQTTYKVQNRSWKALDVLQLRTICDSREEYYSSYWYQRGESFEKALAEAETLGAEVRKRTNAYLHDE